MNCKGIHCQGCGHGGGAAGAVIALAVIVALALRKAWPAIVSAVEITAWTVTGVAGAVLLVTGGVLAARVVRRHRARRASWRSPVTTIAAQGREAVPPAMHPAIDPPHPAGGRAWPLPGCWEEIRPRIGGDGDEHRPR
jgi:hypothetical protein